MENTVLDSSPISEKKENRFYVYMYLDIDNVPFYIGKGQGKRYQVHRHLGKNESNRFLKNKINKIGKENVKIHFLHKDLIEKTAFYWENYWIRYIGRRNKGEGSLTNLTDGGEGYSGRIVSQEEREAISKRTKSRKMPRDGVERQRLLLKEHYKNHPEAKLQSSIRAKEYYKTHDNPFAGKKHSYDTKQQMKESAKIRKYTPESYQRLVEAGKLTKGRAAWNKGVSPSEETREKMGSAMRGRKLTPEQLKNRKWTDERRKKVSDKLKGRFSGENNPMYGKAPHNKGVPMSEEQKKNLSETRKSMHDELSAKVSGKNNPMCGKHSWNAGIKMPAEWYEKYWEGVENRKNKKNQSS